MWRIVTSPGPRRFRIAVLACVGLLALGGCSSRKATHTVADGDRVQVHYTCRLQSGEQVVSTLGAPSGSEGEPGFPLFVPAAGGGRPVEIRASAAGVPRSATRGRGVQAVVEAHLARELVGARVGERRRRVLESETDTELPDGERFLEMARVRRRLKEKSVSRELFARLGGTEDPSPGEEVRVEPGFVGRVLEVEDGLVKLRVFPASDEGVETFLGRGTVRERDDRYDIEIDAREGALIRLGPLLGRIVDVGKDMIRIDFGHPFGGEKVHCDVQVVGIKDGQETRASFLSEQDGSVEGETGSVGQGPPSRSGEPVVQTGDLVRVAYTLEQEDGACVCSTRPGGCVTPGRDAAASCDPEGGFGPEELLAGETGSVPGLDAAVIGLRAGERRRTVLAPEEAYGLHDPSRLSTYPRVRDVPARLRLSTQDFVNRFGSLPRRDLQVKLDPYLQARVAGMDLEGVDLRVEAGDERQIRESFGSVDVEERGGGFRVSLKPTLGGDLPGHEGGGRIVAVDETTFTVDRNHPLAGKPLVLSVEIESILDRDTYAAWEIPWSADHAEALEKASETGKPLVVVLYAPWCTWSRRLLQGTLHDPRVTRLRDDFVWVKVDGDSRKDLMEIYEQKGFPATLILDPLGNVTRRIDGFTDPRKLRDALRDSLEPRVVHPVPAPPGDGRETQPPRVNG